MWSSLHIKEGEMTSTIYGMVISKNNKQVLVSFKHWLNVH